MEIALSPLEFARRARKGPGAREATVDARLCLTYAHFGERCDRWSAALVNLSVRQGDRVATISPNTHQHLEQLYGVPRLGAVIVPMNYWLAADDFIYLTTHSGFAQIAVAMGTARGELTDEALSRIAIEQVIDLLADAGIRKTLADIGVQTEQLQPIAEQSFSAQCLVNNSPVPLGVDSLLTIANAAYTGTIQVKAA